MIRHLYIYPVKGLSGQACESLPVLSGLGIPLDRSIAITRKAGIFDPSAPVALTKDKFLMLMRDGALALLHTHYDAATRRLSIKHGGSDVFDASIDDANAREQLQNFFITYLNDARLEPKLVEAAGHQFTDISVVSPEKMRAISLINLRSIEALEQAVGKPVDHRRFRANIYYRGREPWEEFDWMDREIIINDTRMRVTMTTRRCAATQVNPDTAERDINVPGELKRHFGHFDMGVYAEVIEGGSISLGDDVRVRVLI